MKTIEAFCKEAKIKLLPLYGASEAERMIHLLMEEVAGPELNLRMRSGEYLKDTDLEKLDNFLDQVNQHRPLQYVLGHAWFYGMRFFVDENVLIPRPETEELVDWIAESEGRKRKEGFTSGLKIFDVGTGSGCIAIALKKKFSGANVYAIDISEKAIEVASKNAGANGMEINFLKGDILSEVSRDSIKEKFDVIVSNPPYIRKSEMESIAENVKNFEPHEALFVENDDALIFYKAITGFALSHLEENGKLYFEINESLGNDIQNLLLQKGFQEVEVKKDLSGKERMVRASYNKTVSKSI
jgi:release factor glutamine methyltransferase